jgi:hypothetical protein
MRSERSTAAAKESSGRIGLALPGLAGRVIYSRGMSPHEIVLAETKPETEWVRGRAIGNFGRVGTEWRFRVAPPGKVVRPLVPDVAYLSYAEMAREAPPEIFEIPLASPTVAVEILSPDDRSGDVADEVATYLASGTVAVAVVDPILGEIALHELIDVRSLFDRARR